MRRTKIIATLGPATDRPGVLSDLIAAGTDAVRINCSHGSWEDRGRQIRELRDISAAVGKYVSVICDLQGPKIRIHRFREGPVTLVEGERFVLDTAMDPRGGTQGAVGVAYDRLPQDVSRGDSLLLDDGQIILAVDQVVGSQVICTVTAGGLLSDNKGINRQGGGLSAPALTAKDREDIRQAAAAGVDWLAVSFVRGPEDMREAQALLRDAGGSGHLIAKIERAEAVADLDPIIAASDAVMVARGDLGVEMGYAGLTGMQKKIIRLARARQKVAITATQMMESMVTHRMPTRAEVSDVANAVMDGTDAVMLSSETAVGEFPVQAVAAMAEICVGAETYQVSSGRPRDRGGDQFHGVNEAIAMAVMYTANHLHPQAIIALTESGSTALWMSRVRSDIPIFAFTRHEITRRRVQLYRGVYPVAYDITHSDPMTVNRELLQVLREMGHVEEGDLAIITSGELTGVTGGTNSMKILRVSAQ
ncbi:MAG: pyruvate kinase [Gammaproteobacteria bacterium]|nr:MAG: pyruvate kinase [Gammaproteobacteria bacterium]